MDTKIRFIQTFTRPDALEQPVGAKEQHFCVTLTPEGVETAVGDTMRPTVPWEQLEDVEFLANTFWMLRVWEFRVLINLLARARDARHLVETEQ